VKDSMLRHVQVGEWIFEVKMVRALKVNKYGEPYTAIANCTINGDSLYVDGMLAKENQDLAKNDLKSFYKFSQLMELKEFSYHRYLKGKFFTKKIKVTPEKDKMPRKIDSSSENSAMHLVK